MALPVAAAFVLGTIIGSFVTVVAHRVPLGESVVTGRSRCPSCGAMVRARDNIPIVSWLVLRGRCRDCGQPIPARYPLTELAVGLLWAITVAVLGTDDGAALALGLIFCAVLVAITVTDLERRIIPNRIVLAGSVIALAIAIPADPGSTVERLAAALIAGGILFVIAIAYPKGMGMGDVKLVAMMGLYLGRAIGPALLVGFAAGALAGIAMMLREGAGARKRGIPFGPFLAFGGVIGLWWGDAIVDWYLDSFGG